MTPNCGTVGNTSRRLLLLWDIVSRNLISRGCDREQWKTSSKRVHTFSTRICWMAWSCCSRRVSNICSQWHIHVSIRTRKIIKIQGLQNIVCTRLPDTTKLKSRGLEIGTWVNVSTTLKNHSSLGTSQGKRQVHLTATRMYHKRYIVEAYELRRVIY